MVVKRHSSEVYEEFGIYIDKHRTKDGYFLISEEDGFIYSKLHDSEQAAQSWLDTMIDTLYNYLKLNN